MHVLDLEEMLMKTFAFFFNKIYEISFPITKAKTNTVVGRKSTTLIH